MKYSLKNKQQYAPEKGIHSYFLLGVYKFKAPLICIIKTVKVDLDQKLKSRYFKKDRF